MQGNWQTINLSTDSLQLFITHRYRGHQVLMIEKNRFSDKNTVI
jgi:hypothetical protein